MHDSQILRLRLNWSHSIHNDVIWYQNEVDKIHERKLGKRKAWRYDKGVLSGRVKKMTRRGGRTAMNT